MPITFEAIIPPNLAIIAEAETDNKTRTMSDLKVVLKRSGGVASSSAFYFARRGRAIFKSKDGTPPSLSDILEEAIEHHGIEDVEELPNGTFLAWIEPTQLAAVTRSFAEKFNFEVLDSDIIQAPNTDTIVPIDSPESAETLSGLLAGFKEYPEVKAIYANIRQGSLSNEKWEEIEKHLDV